MTDLAHRRSIRKSQQTASSCEHLPDVLMVLTREIGQALTETEIVAALVRCVRGIFRNRSFCIRIIDPRTYSITSMSMNGSLTCSPDSLCSHSHRERLALRRAAAQKAKLDVGALAHSPVALTEEEPILFDGSARGLAVPVAAAGQLLGILNLEYRPGNECDFEQDEKLLILVANVVAMALSRVKNEKSAHKEIEWRIVQAEKLASLGRLAAGVAHEIKNPLSAITMYSDALLQLAQSRHSKGDGAGELEKLTRIKESADRILRIARDLTSYARPASNLPEKVDLHDILEEAVRYCEHALKQSSAIVYRCYSTLPHVHGVRANLVHVFVNLVINACHALPKESGCVRLSTFPRENGAEVRISDNGSGICEEDLPRIFEPFFSTKAEGSGTGLGLAIVHNIVQKHGGTIHVTSAKGQGATFTIWLPIESPKL